MPASLKWLIVLALFMRAIVPAGFMLGPSGAKDGQHLTMVPCPHHAGKLMPMDGNGKGGSHKPTSDNSVCPYAASGLAGVGTDMPAMLAATVLYASIVYTLEFEQFRSSARVGAVSARGPPAIG